MGRPRPTPDPLLGRPDRPDPPAPGRGVRILLAGATGVLGRRIAPLLVAGDHHVVALVRAPREREAVRALERLGVEIVEGDALDAASLTRAVAAAAPDVVMHQLTDLRTGDSASNAVLRREGTALLMAAVRASGVRRVIAQSIAWAYAPTAAPATEDVALDVHAPDPARRRTVRAVADLETAIATIPEPVALRYGLLYGPDTWFAPGGARAADARAGRLVADDTVTSFVHVDDAARAAVDAVSWPPGPVNVCDDEPAVAREWVPRYCAALGAPAPVPADRADPSVPRTRGADNARARTLGWTPGHPGRCSGLAEAATTVHDPGAVRGDVRVG